MTRDWGIGTRKMIFNHRGLKMGNRGKDVKKKGR